MTGERKQGKEDEKEDKSGGCTRLARPQPSMWLPSAEGLMVSSTVVHALVPSRGLPERALQRLLRRESRELIHAAHLQPRSRDIAKRPKSTLSDAGEAQLLHAPCDDLRRVGGQSRALRLARATTGGEDSVDRTPWGGALCT